MATPATLEQLHRLPGSSTYRVANAAIITLRKALNLQNPFEISFNDWGPKNATFKWYSNLQNRNIQTLHLRKERKAPFFHEFIVLRLKDGTHWRIDRRQHQDEPTPINCISEPGVPAYDTIEQVRGMGRFVSLDPLLSAPSDCMVEIEFKKDVDVGLVLRICREIKAHERASYYTIQRYNCFFYAQTILMCIACGVSDWAGWGEPVEGSNDREGPWKSPNVPLGERWSDMDNAGRLADFKWNLTEKFNHDWIKLSEQSNVVVHTSPVLRHADHCTHCLESQTSGRQRSLSSEINRLKKELVEYWDKEYRQLLDDAYRENHEKFITSGVWGIITANKSEDNCKGIFPKKLKDIQGRWKVYSEPRLKALLASARDILSPKQPCEAWYVDPDEWGVTWNCKDGGPVKVAMENWEKDVAGFIRAEFAKLRESLEEQTIQSSTQVHEAAMKARMESFERAMTIKLPHLNEGEFLKPAEGTNSSGKVMSTDQETVFSKQTKKSFATFVSSKISKVTKRAGKIRNRMRRLFKGSKELEEVQMMQLERRIGVFITRHSDNVQLYKRLLKCNSDEVQKDMKKGMDDVWARVIC